MTRLMEQEREPSSYLGIPVTLTRLVVRYVFLFHIYFILKFYTLGEPQFATNTSARPQKLILTDKYSKVSVASLHFLLYKFLNPYTTHHGSKLLMVVIK